MQRTATPQQQLGGARRGEIHARDVPQRVSVAVGARRCHRLFELWQLGT